LFILFVPFVKLQLKVIRWFIWCRFERKRF